MALEIARMIPKGAQILDVGCGNGYIAHHLSAMLFKSVIGIDLTDRTDAAIDYRQFDGARFPVPDHAFEAVLLCYVLHHAADARATLQEVRRVLCEGGVALIYEDIPQTWWDKAICAFHNLKWKRRTGTCTFRKETEWREVFADFGFELVTARRLSRWRN